VRRLEGSGNLAGDLQRLVDRHRPAPQPIGERLAFGERQSNQSDGQILS
jgi:hypothetical protein